MTPTRRQAAEMHDRALSGNDEAEQKYRLYSSAVAVDPDFAQGWMTLGHRLGDMGLLAASAAAYRRVLECPISNQPGDRTTEMEAQAWCNIALRCYHMGENELALQAAMRCIGRDPNMAFGYTNLAMIWSRQGNHYGAVVAGRKAFALGPDKPENELGLAFALMFAGQYAEGFRHFESRFAYKLKQYQTWPYPKWDGGKVGRLMVVSEQGIGDALSFARFIPAASTWCGHLLYAVQPELVRLLAGALVQWPNVSVIPWPKVFPECDAWAAIASLPWMLNLTGDEIRHATPLGYRPGAPAPAGWQFPGRRFRIGICWGGSKANDIDKWRSLSGPEPFFQLHQVPGIELYSFQVGERAPELHTCGGVGLVKDLSPWLRDAADAAAILSQMDLVITVETFLGHLAGFLNKPCWVLYSWNGQDWRLSDGNEPVMWYPHHRVFRQFSDATWDSVWRRVIDELKPTVEKWYHERSNERGRAAAD